jgi:type I restriction enzyme M protein
MSDSPIIKNHAAFIWSVADLLRGDYKQSEYGKVVLPLTVLRRLDCVLEPTKDKVLEKAKSLKGKIENQEPVLCAVAKEQFFNTSKLDMKKLLDDPTNLAANLRSYISAFSSGARDVLEKFDFDTQIARMDKANILYMVISKFAEIDLHPTVVSNLEMGYLYEELIRKFSELSNETAGEHFTPREVIRLMVNLLFIEDGKVLAKEGTVRTLFDPACGTGGMLSVGEDHLRMLNPKARLEVFGQELNPETYAICRSDMMLKGQDASHITNGNSFSEDGHKGKTFDYCLANPPFGVEWKKVDKEVRDEHERKGFGGRFGAGLPRINDGSFLFLQHMIAKMKSPSEGGSRIAIVFNGSPLFTGAAGSGESEIRRWIIENDWLEAVVALPDNLFYNTGISTYFWIVSNRKSKERQGKVQLIDARTFFVKMRRSLGEKRKEISDAQIDEITRMYGDFTESEFVKIFENAVFGYQRITVERPLRATWQSNGFLTLMDPNSWMREKEDEIDAALHTLGVVTYKSAKETETAFKKVLPSYTAKQIKDIVAVMCVSDEHSPIVKDAKGNPEPDTNLRDNENVPLPAGSTKWEHDVTTRLETKQYRDAINEYVRVEVLPYVPDAWVDYDKTKLGYEIPLTRYFYKHVPPRSLVEIETEIKQLETEIQKLLAEVTE